ncbi:hypothetical protein NP493_799g05013 [Ridgeia piscesae]|uniref:phosphorylase kinase n=1 Tax=Ridgeia piscesae TaxID=27915 RepID=A0AAD9NLK5_RIDPI|nr:hypothetical protein NP493_799g05013 [Ridgeia piscesae]
MTIQGHEDDELPGEDLAKEFYAKYEIRNILGKGISSTVRRCTEKASGQEFAVKIIDLTVDAESKISKEEERIATKREISQLSACAGHPHIIELHDTFETNAFLFLVFEICQKGELFEYLTEVVTLSEKRTRQIMRQLFEAVEFIHSHNIVHRDLKPENILLDDQLNVKLSDFGFATVVNHDHELTDLCGTPGYLAPEVLKVSMYEDVRGYGRPVDLWASGVIMYTLLVGCPPFWHRKQIYMLRAIMEGRYSFYSPEWDDISDTAKDLIKGLLVVDPEQRLTAVAALAHPFLKSDDVITHDKVIISKKSFKSAALAVIAMRRFHIFHFNPQPIQVAVVKHDPYSVKVIRKFIDAGAFRIYGHWVKKGDNQNRAALFENSPKRDLKDCC